MKRKKVAIIGAGPGGLAAAALLQAQNFEVELFEASPQIGGRNGRMQVGDCVFDTGPTFFLMPQILEQIFQSCGRALSDYVELKRLEPLYVLDYGPGQRLEVSGDPRRFSQNLAKFSKHDAASYWRFRAEQEAKFTAIRPVLSRPYRSWRQLADFGHLNALPFLNLRSIYSELARNFEDERVRLAFTFQAKYLGMSPFECPSLFTILPHIEHHLGVWHPVGGCHALSLALGKLFEELGGKLHLCAPVKRCRVDAGRRLRALEIEGQGTREFDYTVMNADFAYAMQELFTDQERRKHTDEKLERLKYSCSAFMVYLSLKGPPPSWPHHQVFFAQNYFKNVRELSHELKLSADPSFYVQNVGVTDSTMAPSGFSTLYLLAPVPNLDAAIDWPARREEFRDLLLGRLEERMGTEIRSRIVAEKILTPLDWRDQYRVHKGAIFSLAHSLNQMLHMRPNNEYEDFRGFYLVGGGTHPGSGLPTIFESARIASRLIEEARAREEAGSWRERLGLRTKEVLLESS